MSGTSSPQQRAKLAREYREERKTRRPDLVPSRTYVNAAIREPYTGNQMRSARANADQHFEFSSRGQTAPQINRNADHQPV